MRVAIVGGGLAGSLLAWRLSVHGDELSTGGADRAAGPEISLYARCLGTRLAAPAWSVGGGAPSFVDATSASGGIVRAYEPDAAARRAASDSLSELRSSPLLRSWSAYREIGSFYLTRSHPTLADLPSSAHLLTRDQLPFHALPLGTVGIVEPHAGHISPHALRNNALAAARAHVHTEPVAAVTASPAIRLADGTEHHFDAVVVAAGPWSPRLLPAAGLRTKRIQYNLYRSSPPVLGAFVDETTGLYGRPGPDGALLAGLPTDGWDADPDRPPVDHDLAGRVTAALRLRFGAAPPVSRTVGAVDCYADPPGLALRPVEPGSRLFSFTGGSGGAVKTALAESRRAAQALTTALHRVDERTGR
jgi:glycine/D-amino acid oxidase-like deaminating enzyme